ncbi:MAG: LytTR family DNA-binding domain-containing protein, partial [Planctomycetota bacterium]
GELLIEESLKALEDEFGEPFVRIHRNCLAAVERIEALTRAPDGRMLLRLRGMKEPVEVSRRNLASLRRMVRTL